MRRRRAVLGLRGDAGLGQAGGGRAVVGGVRVGGSLWPWNRAPVPHSASPSGGGGGAPRTRKRHRQEHRPQRPTERSDPPQHAKGRTGNCPGPRKGATTRRNVTRGGGGGCLSMSIHSSTRVGSMALSGRSRGPPIAHRCRAAANGLVAYPRVVFALHSVVTERYRWSCRPLTSHFSSRAVCADRLLCARAIAQASAGGCRLGPLPLQDWA